MVVSGPNAGGKTVALKTLGLAALMVRAGLPVPARTGSRVAVFEIVLTDVGDDQNLHKNLSTFSAHVQNLVAVLGETRPGALVLLDELCSGTNPSEGEEIFELVVTLLGRLHPQAFITTHFLTFAGRLEREGAVAGLRFLQVDLDPSQKPTYQFVPGVATTSLAGQAAARLGVTRDELAGLIDRNTLRAAAAAATLPR